MIESGVVRRLPLVERILKNKLAEAHIENVEVESATVSEQVLGQTDRQMADTVDEADMAAHSSIRLLTRKLLNSADLVLVMAREQRDFLTKFVDYNRWNCLHVFQHYCFGRDEDLTEPACERENDLLYRQIMESVEEGCRKIVQKVSEILDVSSSKVQQLALE